MTPYTPTLSTQGWIDRQVSYLPSRWKKKLVNRWHSEVPGGRNFQATAGVHPEFSANRHLAGWAQRLNATRLPLDSSDADICGAADRLAGRASELAKIHSDLPSLRAALNRLATGQDVAPPQAWDDEKQKGVRDGAAVARMADPLWWRPKLRSLFAKLREGAAIDLGYVNRARDCYVSNESLYSRAQQNARIEAMKENTVLVNELGQEFTLAELAATSQADKAIRRSELMTRISGFERIANEEGHIGLFMTMTAPGHMHKWLTVKGDKTRVFENRRYDGSLPDSAQLRHAEVWARIRAKCDRYGLPFYGFRIAEPNHDATPHWHLLVFIDPAFNGDPRRDAVRRFCAIVRRYALGQGERDAERKQENKRLQLFPFLNARQARKAHAHKMQRWDIAERRRQNGEAGARAHRVDFKPIDRARGSAAGYIAKYVTKNVDGYKLDADLYGNDAATASQRVEAWAVSWRIRQFQQVGGPPVGPWRELRRVKELPAGAPQHLIDAHQAVNKITDEEAGTVKAAAWDGYCKAQGGVFCGRKALIKISMVQPEGVNRYGEEAAKRPIGVETVSYEAYRPDPAQSDTATRAVHWIVESERHVWEVTRRGPPSVPAPAASRPWTCVNNCTADTSPPIKFEEFGLGNQLEPRKNRRVLSALSPPEPQNDPATNREASGNVQGVAAAFLNGRKS